MKKVIFCLVAAVLVAGLFLGCAPAQPKEKVVLTVVSFLPPNDYLPVNDLVPWIDRVNELGKGEIEIVFIGGSEAIEIRGQWDAVKDGTIDMLWTAPIGCVADVPESDLLILSHFTPWEERESDVGVYDYMDQEFQKHNVKYLGRAVWYQHFRFYMNTKIEDLRNDWKGLKIRSSTVHIPFIEALGAVPVTMRMGETYSGLERGVVDGTAYVTHGVSTWGWHEVTKYITGPMFWIGDCFQLVNLDSWNSLSEKHQKLLMDTWIWNEKRSAEVFKAGEIEEEQLLIESGMELLTYPAADEKWFVEFAEQSVWDHTERNNPEVYARWKELMRKP